MTEIEFKKEVIKRVRGQIKDIPIKTKCANFDEVKKWTDKHPENKPHIITKSNNEELIIIY